jgi:hypothetical protein
MDVKRLIKAIYHVSHRDCRRNRCAFGRHPKMHMFKWIAEQLWPAWGEPSNKKPKLCPQVESTDSPVELQPARPRAQITDLPIELQQIIFDLLTTRLQRKTTATCTILRCGFKIEAGQVLQGGVLISKLNVREEVLKLRFAKTWGLHVLPARCFANTAWNIVAHGRTAGDVMLAELVYKFSRSGFYHDESDMLKDQTRFLDGLSKHPKITHLKIVNLGGQKETRHAFMTALSKSLQESRVTNLVFDRCTIDQNDLEFFKSASLTHLTLQRCMVMTVGSFVRNLPALEVIVRSSRIALEGNCIYRLALHCPNWKGMKLIFE